tara:strand:+ start:377 stop:523 length:147 start_codon:yes stop_codon:yes gene_type:complete
MKKNIIIYDINNLSHVKDNKYLINFYNDLPKSKKKSGKKSKKTPRRRK